jgi:radical SAM superfamily enzyme YgiQ (UPF0313 family)
MSLTQHIGYGRFQLQDLLPGETFKRFDGTLAKVCNRQPYRTPSPFCNHPHLPDYFEVWTEHGTSNARKVFLHKTALVHAITPEQAREIAARLHERTRKQ